MAGNGDYFPIGKRRTTAPPMRVAAFNAIERHRLECERLHDLEECTIVKAIIALVIPTPGAGA